MSFWRRTPIHAEFPEEFTVQEIGVLGAKDLVGSPPLEIANYFRRDPAIAQRLLLESYDKRYSPSTFLEEVGDRFRVGWFSRKLGRQYVKEFTDLADAATDYLLFSRGVGRYSPSKPANTDSSIE